MYYVIYIIDLLNLGYKQKKLKYKIIFALYFIISYKIDFYRFNVYGFHFYLHSS